MPRFTTSEPIGVTLDVSFGTVQITANDRHEAVVQVLPTDPTSHKDVKAAERTLVEYAGGRLRVTDPGVESRAWLGRGGSIRVMLDVPTGSDLNARIAAADLSCDGRLGQVRIHSAHGHVQLGEADTIDVKADSGDVVVGLVHADARAETTYRHIRIGTVAGALRAESGSGEIAVEHAHADVTASSKYGNIRIGEVVRGTVTLECGSGQMELGVSEGVTAHLDVDAKHGTVRNLLDERASATDTVDVRAVSLHGNILIRRTHPRS